MELISPNAFFGYVIVLTVSFTMFAMWRLRRRKFDRLVEEREEFLAYPQTSPEIYAWLPYHREPVNTESDAHGAISARPAADRGAAMPPAPATAEATGSKTAPVRTSAPASGGSA
jgi:hypothetical protein